jgi:hypothetical protein
MSSNSTEEKERTASKGEMRRRRETHEGHLSSVLADGDGSHVDRVS